MARRFALLAVAAPLTVMATGCTQEPVPEVQQPDWNLQPIYDRDFGSFADGEDCNYIDIDPNRNKHCADFVSVATGGGDVFVSSDDTGRVEVYDGTSLAHKRTITDQALGDPRGIAYYRDELFVLDGNPGDVFVFDPATGARKRTLLNPATLGSTDFVEPLMATGLDAAWGEVWITLRGGLGGGGISVLDAQTGAVKGVQWHQARVDGMWRWWDIATVPEAEGLLAQCRFIARADIGHPVPIDEVQVDEAIGDNDCARMKEQGGVDAVWGMRWFLTIQEPRDGRPLTVNEYAIEAGGAAGTRLSPLRRTWRPRHTDPHGGEYTHYDIAYQAREARIDWSGPLTTTNWLRGTRCVDYVVSDADIYVVGGDGERWYEPARGFQKIEFRVDGVPRLPVSTSPSGQFCFDTNSMPSGTHTVSLKAWVNNGTRTLEVANDSANFDHTPPTGPLDAMPRFVSGTVNVSGAVSDPHSGPRDWQAQLQPTGGGWQNLCDPLTAAGAADGKYACSWPTDQFTDGNYEVRAAMRDNVSEAWGGPNLGWSPQLLVGVDNTSPSSVGATGELRDAEDYRPLADGDRPGLDVTVSDAGSGGVGADLLIDGLPLQTASGTCPNGGCTFSHHFELVPENLEDGEHTVAVTGRDALGHARTTASWKIDIERLPAETPDHGDPTTESDSEDVTGAPSIAQNQTAQDDPVADALGLLPCTSSDQPANFPTYSLGASFEGMTIAAVNRVCEKPSPHELPRPNFVEYIYGTCVPDPTFGTCQPPITVQSWPACERNLSSYGQSGIEEFQLDYLLTQLRGVPAAIFEDATRNELYTADATVIVFGTDSDQATRAVNALRQEPPNAQPGALAPVNALDIGGKLPPPLPGALKGRLPCQ